MKDELVLVDLNDNVIGYGNKLAIHKDGLLHSAFSVFIYNKNKMLLQKRNSNKYHSGNLWTNACCSHPRKGENIKDAIQRRLLEEMGFDCNLKEEFSFIYRTVFNNNIIEYELDHVFLGQYNGNVNINLDEACEYKWIEISELKNQLVNNPSIFTSWFIISAPEIIKIIEEDDKL